jgi:pimeloyl-ACP methyl ester carboxylesterase
MEAVLAYTGSAKVHVIGHSMGVTLSRRVIKGGLVDSSSTPFNLGPSLANRVDTYIGIAGANYGLTNCYLAPFAFPTCNSLNGFYPGYALGPLGLSRYLAELNSNTVKEGDHTFAIFSTSDDLIGYGDIVWGQYTSLWPTCDESKTFTFEISCHMKLRDDTADDQYSLITSHKFASPAFAGDNSSTFLQ